MNNGKWSRCTVERRIPSIRLYTWVNVYSSVVPYRGNVIQTVSLQVFHRRKRQLLLLLSSLPRRQDVLNSCGTAVDSVTDSLIRV